MDYTKIILELLDRIKTLEEKVDILTKNQEMRSGGNYNNYNSYDTPIYNGGFNNKNMNMQNTIASDDNNLYNEDNINEQKLSTTQLAKNYIAKCKYEAKMRGEPFIDITANDIQKALGIQNRAPIACNAMMQSMKSNDIILVDTPSGASTTKKIRFFVK